MDDIPVIYAGALGGAEGAGAAFDELELHLPSLGGGRFFGTFQIQTGEYRACVRIRDDDNPSAMGLYIGVIPASEYERHKIANWAEHVPEIGQTFDAVAVVYKANRSRPSVELYLSQPNLFLYSPVAS